MAGSKRVWGFGLAVAVALAVAAFFMAGQITTTSAIDSGPEMRLVVKEGAECSDGKCTIPTGAPFTLTTEIVEGPPEGYIGAQVYIKFGFDLVYNLESAADQTIWPDAAEATCVGGQPGGTAPEGVRTIGCLTGLIPPLPVSTYTGNAFEISFNCSAGDSSTEVELLPLGDPEAGGSGAGFLLEDFTTEVIPKVSNLIINCGAGDVTDPTPTPTPTPDDVEPTPTPDDVEPTPTPDEVEPTATFTPTPTATPVTPTATPDDKPCGDVNGDGIVNAIDALFVLQFSAELIQDLPQGVEAGDLNNDGVTNAVDAALILQIVAGLYSC